MTVDQILSLGSALAEFLDEFADCFGRSEPREHLNHYVRGQLSNLQRKSVEPIALFNNIAPRTLQEFLNTDVWDHPRARERLQYTAWPSSAVRASASRFIHANISTSPLRAPVTERVHVQPWGR